MTPTAADAPSRVAEPTPSFWLVKVLTTGMGETSSDFLVKTFDPVLVVPIAVLVLAAALAVQLASRRYRPARYWTTALLVSVVGTMAADVLHVGLGVPYAASTAGFAVVLAVVFVLWWRVCGTLSVHRITALTPEVFFWATVMTTFALGTAAGDLTATVLGLGYLGSGVLFAVVFALPGALYAATRRFAVGLFWAAYVVTRPLGASFADFAAVAPARGGLGLGTGYVSAVLLAVFVAAVAALAASQRRGLSSGGVRSPASRSPR